MRIVLTSESYLPYVSGVTVSVDALARGLGAAGHEVMVVAPRPARGTRVEPVGSPGPAPIMAWLPSYRPPAIVPPRYRMPWPILASSGWRAARAFAPDVVHAHSPFVSGVLARRLARTASVPLIFTHHTRFDDYSHYAGPLSAVARHTTNAWLGAWWRGSDAVIAPSFDLAGWIRERIAPGSASRVHAIPTGVDVAGIRALATADVRALAGWPEGSVVIASLGRLAPEKSPELLIDAFAGVAGRHPRLRLLVVGGGPSDGGLRARVLAAGLTDRVHFTGPLPRTVALATVAGADIFAFASRSETQGLVLAEALTAGLPAVAVEGPGVRDSVRDGIDGVIVAHEPTDTLVVRLGRAIAALADDPDRREALARSAKEDAERFSLSRQVGAVEALYRLTRERRQHASTA
ncbi:MAG: glycosyltransferase [Candidatus Limnocylindria bacterium]